MSAAVMSDNGARSIVCQYRYPPSHPRDGYYEMRTENGEFLCNVDASELSEEINSYRKRGYILSRIKGSA